MKSPVPKRIALLRKAMVKEKLDAIYISGTDPHMNEYLCDHWLTRNFITGFTGSYGEVAVTRRHAGLWTDTRYFLQAEEELKGTGIILHKLRTPDAIPVTRWLPDNLHPGDKVGIDPSTCPMTTFRMFQETFREKNIEIVFQHDLLTDFWFDRAPLPQNPVYELPQSVTGESRQGKIARICEALKSVNADLTVITALDDLAWTYNLRGSDIPYNPLFFGFAIIGRNENHFFVQNDSVSPETILKLKKEGTVISDYNSFYHCLSTVSGKTFYLDPSSASTEIWSLLHEKCQIVEGISIPAEFKSVKNQTEIEGFRCAMLKDGIALLEFLYWLKSNLAKVDISEFTVGRKLTEFRSKQLDFKGESFSPIVGYHDHGAVVHLHVDESVAYYLNPEGVLLFDSGGHYMTGTTDITRTIALGPVTCRQKTDFTLVLRGMIALSMAVFPAGTKGIHLDILARLALWKEGLNYGHGTGHGVGHFLNVHEGPAAIRHEYVPHEIKAGMVFSNEPGIYRSGEYGIRTENVMVCVEKENKEFGRFLGFETLTLCPIDTTLIVPEMMTSEERTWLNNYHLRVREELTPFLSHETTEFLKMLTKTI